MTKPLSCAFKAAGLIAAVALTGCNSSPSNPQAGYPPPYPVAQAPAMIVVMDDYDYYPGYEVYYSRNRREYVYLQDRSWVRGPAPRDVTVAMLFASPSVRMDFRDSPEHHHYSVIRSYPRNWRPEGARIRAEQAAAEQARMQEEYRQQQAVAVQVVYADDYDYYPGYEVYYSRNRQEYVYLEGGTWVRRSAPRHVTREALFASPSVRMEFRDSPEQHHNNVVRSYPRNWISPERIRAEQAAAERARIQEQNRQRQVVAVQVAVSDDYDYYPGHEVYHSRTRGEFVYLEGRTWVRRPAPRNVTPDVLFASPSVRMEFRDSPEQHHNNVVRSYPRNWMPESARIRAEQARMREQNRERSPGAVQIVVADEYDYYPGYEVYYSRNRQEYVYLEGRTWVRRPAPRGVTVAALFASPSVRMDFQDAPEHHHGNVQRSYPKNWSPPGRGRGNNDRDDRDDRDDKADRKGRGRN